MSRASFIDQSPEGKNFPNLDVHQDSFRFGLETEYVLADAKTICALTYRDINFDKINSLISNIPFNDLPGDFSPLGIELPMTKASPIIVEGYSLVDESYKPIDMLPKGVEIRSSVCSSISECLFVQKELYKRLKTKLLEHDLTLLSLSHHPSLKSFRGPQNKRRYDWWQWAMQVMTTYGPDINISVPTRLLKDFDLEDFDKKVNYYGPALSALSTGAPFFGGELGDKKSYRMHKRSIVAPAIEYHEDEENRFEFKLFDMSPYEEDFRAFFLVVLALILNKDLKGRADRPERIYELGHIAQFGLEAFGVKEKLNEFFKNIESVLLKEGFDPAGLHILYKRFQTGMTLSDEIKKMRHPLRFLSQYYEGTLHNFKSSSEGFISI